MGYVTRAELREGLSFDIEQQGHRLKVDADPEHGGTDYGPRPKALLLSGLAGCTGMDVASILQKMQMPFDSFALEVDAQQTDSHPMVYKSITVRYIFTGSQLDRDKIEKAIKLSQTKYCGVAAMLGKSAEISYEIVMN